MIKIRDFFTVNLDKTCFMASKGHLQVVGSAAKKKQKSSEYYCGASWICSRCGGSTNIPCQGKGVDSCIND